MAMDCVRRGASAFAVHFRSSAGESKDPPLTTHRLSGAERSSPAVHSATLPLRSAMAQPGSPTMHSVLVPGGSAYPTFASLPLQASARQAEPHPKDEPPSVQAT